MIVSLVRPALIGLGGGLACLLLIKPSVASAQQSVAEPVRQLAELYEKANEA